MTRPMGPGEQEPSIVGADAVDQELIDEVDLAALGHGQALSRKFDIWSILALAFCVLGTWSTFAQVCPLFFPPSLPSCISFLDMREERQ